MGLMVVLREILRRHTCNRSFQAVAETDVKALDAHKMIEAAASTPDQAAIDLEEFKRIIRVSAAWMPPLHFCALGMKNFLALYISCERH